MSQQDVQKIILIVDDEPDLREILQFELEDAGYNTLEAGQAHEAIEQVRKHKPDMVVSDIRMPEGDGLFLLDSLRKESEAYPPMVFVTGFADITPEEAYHRGINRVFTKPMTIESLLEFISFSLKEPQERYKKTSDWGEFDTLEKSLGGVDELKDGKDFVLGRGGFFAALDDQSISVGDKFHFKVNVGESCLEGLAISLWQRGSNTDVGQTKGVGAQFLELTESSITLLETCLQNWKLVPHIPSDI